MAIDPAVTREQRYEQGRALRARCPRSSHEANAKRSDGFDPLALIEQSNEGRIQGLIPVRYERMSQSVFAFFRGCAVVHARDLAATPVSGPVVQLCGDCHIANFGGFATPERNLVFDINDFDETFPGPWEWDIKRLATSLVLAARDLGFSKGVAREAVIEAVASYRLRTAEYARLSTLDVWYQQIGFENLAVFFRHNADVSGNLGAVEKYARERTSETVFPKLAAVQDGRPTIVDDPPLIYHFHERVAEVEALITELFERYRHSLSDDRRRLFERYRLEDVAIKVVGIGSVGTRCAVALFMSDSTDPLFLQIKEARRSVLQSPADPEPAYKHQGERVVNGQRLMQAASDIFLGWTELPDAHEYYVRQLRDMKVSVDFSQFERSALVDYGVICGWALARAHAKAGDPATIAGYLGRGDNFDLAIAKYAATYADQMERDFEAFTAAIRAGRLSTDVGDEPLDFVP